MAIEVNKKDDLFISQSGIDITQKKEENITTNFGSVVQITDIKRAGQQSSIPSIPNVHWQAPVLTKASLPLVGNRIDDARVVENGGNPLIYICIATSGTVDEQWLLYGGGSSVTESYVNTQVEAGSAYAYQLSKAYTDSVALSGVAYVCDVEAASANAYLQSINYTNTLVAATSGQGGNITSTYVQEASANALYQANTYTDIVSGNLSEYIDVRDNTILNQSQQYANSLVESTSGNAGVPITVVEAASANSLLQANAYTDNVSGNLSSYIDIRDNTILQSANEYTLTLVEQVSGQVNEHNELQNIQGGNVTERYHLTQAEYLDNASKTYVSSETENASANALLLANQYTESYVDNVSGNLSQYIDIRDATKEPLLGFTPENVANKENITLDTSATKYPTNNLVKTYVDGVVIGTLNYRGGYDASSNTFPSTGGSGIGGIVQKGNMWIISVAGTLGGQAVQIGDGVIANIDNPGQTASNWNILNGNVSYVPEDQANKENTTLDTSIIKYPTNQLVLSNIQSYSVASSGNALSQANTYTDTKAKYLSAGMVTIPTYTDIGTGSVVIGTVVCNIHSDDAGSSLIQQYTVSGGVFTLTDLITNYIVVNYNGGTPVMQKTTDVSIINETTIIPVYTIYRDGNDLCRLTWDNLGNALVNKIHQSIVKTQRFRRETGLALGESPTRIIQILSGRLWQGAVSVDLDTIASNVDTISLYTHSAGNWVSTPITQYDNTYYDDGTNIQTLSNNKYGVNWIYRAVDSDCGGYVLLGGGDYSLLEAQAAKAPSTLPSIVSSTGYLVGRIIVQKGASTATQIDSAFDVQFLTSPITNHNDLSGLQGGSIDEYYHLNQSQYNLATSTATSATTGLLTNQDWTIFNNKQNNLGYIPENIANKSTDILLGGATPSNTLYPSQQASKSYIDQRWIDIQRYGFLNQTETIIGFNPTTYTFTISGANGADWSYYRSGIKCTISGTKTTTITGTPPEEGLYYIYIDSTDGSLINSLSYWTLADTKVPVATVYFSDGRTPKYQLSEERHTCLIDRRIHKYEHESEGTRYISGAELDGYVLGSSTEADKTFSIASTRIADEDIFQTLPALADPNGLSSDYVIVYRVSSTGWAYENSLMPFKYVGAGYIQYDNAGTMTDSINNRYVNTYLLASNIQGQARFMIVPGRGSFSTTALAYAESFASFTLPNFITNEAVALYQLTWATNIGASLGRCSLNRVQRISSNLISSTTVVSTEHNGLAGLQGGAVGEYFHLDGATYTDVATKTYVTTQTQNASGNALTQANTYTNLVSANIINYALNEGLNDISIQPTDNRISIASKGGILKTIDNATGDIAVTSSSWIEDEKYGIYFYRDGSSASAEFDSTNVRTGRLVGKIETLDVTGKGRLIIGYNGSTGASLNAQLLSKYAIPLKPNTKYKLTTWINFTNLVNIQTLGLHEHQSDGTRTVVNQTALESGNSPGWVPRILTFTTSASSMYGVINTGCSNAGSGQIFYVDINSITLEEVVESTVNVGNIASTQRPIFKAVTSNDNVDQYEDALGAYSNVFYIGTTVSESATGRQTFTPTKKGVYKIGVFPIDSGDGVSWTLWIHNSTNTLVSQATISAANIVTGQMMYFDVPFLWTSGSYHFHLTASATTGEPTIKTNVLNDMETCSFIQTYGKKSEGFTVVLNGVKTEFKDGKDGILSDSIFDLDNGKYKYYKGTYTLFGTSNVGDNEKMRNDLYSNTINYSPTNYPSLAFGGGNQSPLIWKINTVLPTKNIRFNTIIQAAADGSRYYDIHYSFDNVVWYPLDINQNKNDVQLNYNFEGNGNSTFYIRIQDNVLGTGNKYLKGINIEADLDTSRLPFGDFYPLSINQFTETTTLLASATRIYFRVNKYTNENGIVMPALEFADTSANYRGHLCLKIDNSLETSPAVGIIKASTTNAQNSGTGSDSGDKYILNDGEYMTLTTATQEFSIVYQVGTGTTTLSPITKNVLYLSSDGYGNDATQDSSHQFNFITGVRNTGILQKLVDIDDKMASLRSSLSYNLNQLVGNLTYYPTVDQDWILKNNSLNKSIRFFGNSGGINTELLTLDHGNNRIGINNNAPSVALDVIGTHLSGTGMAIFKGTAGNGFISLTSSASGESGFLVKSNNVLIGQFGVRASDNAVYIKNRIFGTTDLLTILPSGNVGIDNTTPSGKFTIKSSGYATTLFRGLDNATLTPLFELNQGVVGNGNFLFFNINGSQGVLLGGAIQSAFKYGACFGWEGNAGTTNYSKTLSAIGTGMENVVPSTYGAEVLTNGALTSGTSWTAANDASLTGDKAVFTYALGTNSYINQTAASFATPMKASTWYSFTVTITGSVATQNGYAGISISTGNIVLTTRAINGVQTFYFKSATSVPTQFRLQSTLLTGQTFTIDDLSVKEITSGGLYTGGGTNGLTIMPDGTCKLAQIGTNATSYDTQRSSGIFDLESSQYNGSSEEKGNWTIQGIPGTGSNTNTLNIKYNNVAMFTSQASSTSIISRFIRANSGTTSPAGSLGLQNTSTTVNNFTALGFVNAGDMATMYLIARNLSHSGTIGRANFEIWLANSAATANVFTISSSGDVVAGPQVALATTDTNGFIYIPTCAGTPTGVPTSYTGKVAMVFDTSNSKLYCYNGSWIDVT